MRRRKLSADDLHKHKMVSANLSPYSEKDRELVQRLVKEAQDPVKYRGWGFPSFSPELRGLLFVDKSNIIDRASQLVAATNLVVALILSGVVEYGLRPVPVADFDDQTSRVLVEIYNTLGAALLTIALFCSLYTTYFLMALTSETPTTIYRGIARGAEFFVVFQYMTAFSAVLIVVMIGVSSAIWSSLTGCIVTCSVVAALTVYLGFSFVRSYMGVCLDTCVSWTGYIPWNLVRGVREDGQRLGRFRLAKASHLHEIIGNPVDHVTGCEGSEGEQGAATSSALREQEFQKEVSEVREFLLSTLPRATSARIEAIAHEMVTEEITIDALKRIMNCQGGLRLLYDALDFQDVSLHKGERMAIAAAAATLNGSAEEEEGGLGQSLRM
mmetsp:Transcript_87743/g.183418  ORF Transcript_87743/g.183418 Transcript_87743/m.183418 type:complete len:384 (-) Transcript_87743:39-1190(-)